MPKARKKKRARREEEKKAFKRLNDHGSRKKKPYRKKASVYSTVHYIRLTAIDSDYFNFLERILLYHFITLKTDDATSCFDIILSRN